jgi:hypothetical protein
MDRRIEGVYQGLIILGFGVQKPDCDASQLDTRAGISLIFSVSAHISLVEVSMNPQYDIFKKTDHSVVWVEAVEDIVAAKKRLISLSSTTPGEYKLWDSSRQEFINPMDECA